MPLRTHGHRQTMSGNVAKLIDLHLQRLLRWPTTWVLVSGSRWLSQGIWPCHPPQPELLPVCAQRSAVIGPVLPHPAQALSWAPGPWNNSHKNVKHKWYEFYKGLFRRKDAWLSEWFVKRIWSNGLSHDWKHSDFAIGGIAKKKFIVA